VVTLADAAVGGLRAEQEDHFSSASWKLALLLELRANDRVLVIGAVSPALTSGLRTEGCRLDQVASAEGAAGSTKYRAILWNPTADDFARGSAAVAGLLEPDGRLLAFCSHRLSLFRGRHSLRAMLNPALRTLDGYRALLSRAGLRSDECWLPWPNLEDAEEYLAADDAREISLSSGARSNFAARLRAWAHDGFVIVATLAQAPSVPAIGARLGRAAADFMRCSIVTVTRFDLRQRGALVVMLQSADHSQSWVARVCRHAEVAAHIEANEHVVRLLRDAVAGNSGLLNVLPHPLGRIEMDCGTVLWIEERLPGTVAWRVPMQARGALDKGWMDFLSELTRLARPVTLDQSQAVQLVQRWRGNARGNLPRELEDEVEALERWLTQRLVDLRGRLGWAHGDFGYGNLLADPTSGQLQAVIDWETGRPDELSGIDWVNMLLVAERTRPNGNLVSAVDNVARRLRAGSDEDWGASALKRLLAECDCDAGRGEELLGLALLRIVQREARYPSLLAAALPEFTAALSAFRNLAAY
jgi:hypothetical protein